MSTSESTSAIEERRLPRYSLRTLIIAFSLLGVLLAWIGIELRQRREEGKLCALCIRLGATVTYTGEEGGKVTVLNFGNSSDLNDEQLKQLARFSRLRTLWLNRNQPPLRSKVTGRGLAALVKFPALRELHVDRDLLTDDGLQHLKQLTKLEKLTIWGLPFDDARHDELQSAMPWCKVES